MFPPVCHGQDIVIATIASAAAHHSARCILPRSGFWLGTGRQFRSGALVGIYQHLEPAHTLVDFSSNRNRFRLDLTLPSASLYSSA
jgi:hypothetical protein